MEVQRVIPRRELAEILQCHPGDLKLKNWHNLSDTVRRQYRSTLEQLQDLIALALALGETHESYQKGLARECLSLSNQRPIDLLKADNYDAVRFWTYRLPALDVR